MKLLNKVKEIIESHNLKPIELPEGYRNIYDYLKEFPEKRSEYQSEKTDKYFIDKYDEYIPIRWYGFSLGVPIITEWLVVIEEILDMCVKIDPDFIIFQIKLKFGRINFNVHSEVITDCDDIDKIIITTMYDKMLIY